MSEPLFWTCDDSYLYWIAENLDDHAEVQKEAKEQLTLRRGEGVVRRES